MGAISSTTELDEALLQRFNVDYSKNLWNEARRLGIPYVYASSAAVYGDGAQLRNVSFVDDSVEALIAAGLNEAGAGQVFFAVGTGSRIPAVEIKQINRFVEIAQKF